MSFQPFSKRDTTAGFPCSLTGHLKLNTCIPPTHFGSDEESTSNVYGWLSQASADTWNAFETADAAPTTAAAAASSGGDDLWADFSTERDSVSAAAKDPVGGLFSLHGGSNGGAPAPRSASAAMDPFGFDAFSEPSPSSTTAPQPSV